MIARVIGSMRAHIAAAALSTLLAAVLSGCGGSGVDPDSVATTEPGNSSGATASNPRPSLTKAVAFKACSDWLNRGGALWTLDPDDTVIGRSGNAWLISGVGVDHSTGDSGGTEVQVSCTVSPDGHVKGTYN
jgi:hypothetical protein